MPTTAQAELIRELQRGRRLHDERAALPELAAALDRLAHWQARRLKNTYADLAREPRYAEPIAFFQSDLYGPGDFSRRDADLARVVPVMVRVLPEGVIATVAKAMELSRLSHELDRLLLAKLDPRAPLSVAAYCEAYRTCANRAERQRQIALIVDTGRSLDRYVGKPMIHSALAVMRRPARVAGLGALHDFLKRGFGAFARMGGAKMFLATIDARETALMEAIFAGDPAPFPDPLA